MDKEKFANNLSVSLLFMSLHTLSSLVQQNY